MTLKPLKPSLPLAQGHPLPFFLASTNLCAEKPEAFMHSRFKCRGKKDQWAFLFPFLYVYASPSLSQKLKGKVGRRKPPRQKHQVSPLPWKAKNMVGLWKQSVLSPWTELEKLSHSFLDGLQLAAVTRKTKQTKPAKPLSFACNAGSYTLQHYFLYNAEKLVKKWKKRTVVN